ncbi:MAG: hypothetical protein H7178_06380 [Chitinophagaceae bacterium]|nr:hypothetical protein [Chitinophagaceae bacterium]
MKDGKKVVVYFLQTFIQLFLRCSLRARIKAAPNNKVTRPAIYGINSVIVAIF